MMIPQCEKPTIDDLPRDASYVDPAVLREINERFFRRSAYTDRYAIDDFRVTLSPKATAYHEAGHVVVYEAVGIRCVGAKIMKKREAEKIGFAGWTYAPTYPDRYELMPPEVLNAIACGRLGGFAAEIMYLKDKTLAEASCCYELKGAETMLAIAGALDRFDEFLSTARRLLADHHCVHNALAKRLFEKRRLTQADVARIVAPIRRTVDQLDTSTWSPPESPKDTWSFVNVYGGFLLHVSDAVLRAALRAALPST